MFGYDVKNPLMTLSTKWLSITPSLMFVCPVVTEELKLTYLRTHAQTELCFIYWTKKSIEHKHTCLQHNVNKSGNIKTAYKSKNTNDRKSDNIFERSICDCEKSVILLILREICDFIRLSGKECRFWT